ncbi:MAG: BTAD domain-containing putative transcriptional regulator [Ilumatobacteraceae bacterium]
MDGRFRFSAPAPQETWVPRPRLVRRLRRRFEVALTVVVAHAGYGKTSLLSQAVADAAADRSGVDLWVQCTPDDADPEVLVAAILTACGMQGTDDQVSAAVIADRLAWHAPDQVCLILDDVHRIPPGSPSWALLDELLDHLPHNAHVLLSGRVNPSVTLARRELAGAVERIGLVDLEYNDDELMSLGTDMGSELSDASRWPAVMALGGVSGSSPATFLIEEVVASWEPAQRDALTALAHLAAIDDSVAAVVIDGATAAQLLRDVPLVQQAADGSFQLHDLWRDALLAEPPTVEARRALERIGQVLLSDERIVEAAEIFQAAGSTAGVAAAAERLVAKPFILVHSQSLERMLEIATASLSESIVPELVAGAIAGRNGDEHVAVSDFERAARDAARRGDEVGEVLALQQAVNLRTVIDAEDTPAWIGERADHLVERGHQSARNVSVLVRYRAARNLGRVDDAADALRELVPPTNDRDVVAYTFGMTDLGRPEQIDVPGIAAGELDTAKERIDLAVGVWLRGLVSPETALELGRPLLADAGGTGYAHIEIQANAVFSLIALSAGLHGEARQYADTANARSSATASIPVRGFAHLADVMCTLAERGEDDAAAALGGLLEKLPIDVWPQRPYLFALPAVYVLAPQVRPVLDGCKFGPALSASLAAGQALVALRGGDPAPAARLPWDRPDLLRAHVLPCHLGSLAAAVAAVGHSGVGPVLSTLPDARVHLQRATLLAHEPTARWAAARVARLPARPDYDISIDVLGPLRLRHGDTDVVDQAWVSRQRVRQLLAFLVVHRRISRRDTAEALWPDLAVPTALSNLRVNLTHLQRILQPGRDPDVQPWFVRADSDWLSLANDGVVVDAERFDDTLRRARALDESGRSGRAREAYAEAVDLDRGGFLDEWPDATWAEFERLRLRTASIAARCRLGELLMAAGEPEAASSLAEGVLRTEPLQERAGRLLVHSLAAQGDRATAFHVAAGLVERLRDAGLRPEPGTDLMTRGYGISPS